MFEVSVNAGVMIFLAVVSFFLVDVYLVIFSKNKIRDVSISIFFWILFLIFINSY